MATLFGGEAHNLCWELGLDQKARPPLNTSPANVFAYNNQDMVLMITIHILMVFWGSKVGT
jgi:hypothetical protein